LEEHPKLPTLKVGTAQLYMMHQKRGPASGRGSNERWAITLALKMKKGAYTEEKQTNLWYVFGWSASS